MKIDNCLSAPFTTTSGVPQGSHLGPLLFNLYINDSSLIFSNVKFLYFADDLKIFYKITSPNDCSTLQYNVNKFSVWSKDNALEINIPKCSLISFHRTKNKINYPYTLQNTPLEEVITIVTSAFNFQQILHFLAT